MTNKMWGSMVGRPGAFATLALALLTACGAATGTSGGGASGGMTGTGGGAPAGSGGRGSGGAASAGTGGMTAGSGGATGTGGVAPGTGGAEVATGGTGGGTGGTGAGGALGSGGVPPATGGRPATGGVTAPGGNGNPGGGGTPATGGTPGSCDRGTTTTSWASDCPTAPPTTCTGGTWMAGGPDPDHSTYTKLSESDHFAVYSDESPSGAQAAVDHLETVWKLYFGSPMYMREPLCTSATKYKVSIHVHSDFGLTGGSWATGRMGMWIGTGGLMDHWGLAHEFMHGVQAVEGGLACSQTNTCGWIFESHANWAAQQQVEYHTTNVHCSEYLPNSPHLYLGSTRDRYCNWQFMEYLKDRFCYSAVNAIWTSMPSSADPFTAIMKSRGWTVAQLNDFFAEWAMHNITWDYQDPPPESTAGGNQGPLFRSNANYGPITDTSKPERRLRTVKMEVVDAPNRRYAVPALQAPQRWGYNVVRLYPDAGATQVTVTFRGVTQAAANSDWRWGLVATDAAITKSRYSTVQSGSDGALTFCVNAGEALWLVVMGTPSVQQAIVWDQLYPTIYRYPYLIQVDGAQPDGYQPAAPNPSTNGARWANGGGWVATAASVASGAYVGPYAAVLGGTVGATARIDDHAVILGGSVSSGTVSGLTIMSSSMTVSGTATVKVSWAQGPGWFEKPQSVSGTAQLLGDIEYRGANMTETSGSYCGFVDNTISSNCTAADVTAAPPYAWRP